MKRTRIGYTIYSPDYSHSLRVGECWDYGTIRGAKRKARELGIGAIVIRDFTHANRAGLPVGDWWQTQFCWVWNGFEFQKAYSLEEKKWLLPDHHWFEDAALRRLRSAF